MDDAVALLHILVNSYSDGKLGQNYNSALVPVDEKGHRHGHCLLLAMMMKPVLPSGKWCMSELLVGLWDETIRSALAL